MEEASISNLTNISECGSASRTVEDSPIKSLFELQLRTLIEALENILTVIGSLEKSAETGGHGTTNLKDEVDRFEAAMIQAALLQTRGNQARAARLLGTNANTLNFKIRRLGLSELVQEL